MHYFILVLNLKLKLYIMYPTLSIKHCSIPEFAFAQLSLFVVILVWRVENI